MSLLNARAGLNALAAAALLTLPGCISLLPESEPDSLYRLDAAPQGDAGLNPDGETVVVGPVDAPRGLAGDRIAIEREGRIAYMAGAAWLSPAPALFHDAVMDALYADAPAISPARVQDGVSARYGLDLELRHFEAVYDAGQGGAPLVRVSLRARLIDRDSRALIASRLIEADRRAGANRQGAVVDAFSAASADVASTLADWTEAQICRGEDAAQACRERPD